jgi:hypothetical protein
MTAVTRELLRRRLLGGAALLLALVPAYLVSRSAPAGGTPVATRPALEEALEESWPAGAPTELPIDAYIKEFAARYDVPERVVAAVIAVESEFNPRAVSRRGARGLMQLMPATAPRLSLADFFDPRANINAGVMYLRELMDRFDNNLPLALAAYNAGECAVARHGGVPPYRETQRYVARILRRLDRREIQTSLRLDEGHAARAVQSRRARAGCPSRMVVATVSPPTDEIPHAALTVGRAREEVQLPGVMDRLETRESRRSESP